ncbi:SVSP family protein [Theileria parva strain Muguga]|uniref:Theileria-specific sub-telomeric protein, SVSP family n=1 Tax=Theileria parva TaxID=5875 RepID=Q4N9U2_THEPA|nr:SVSP family protein [Theileria parva strain Muguga]EAN33249.1 SVSP family protein [Theileria parva strain Muguga]|eukprot:XP_765532.1 hypothetical protein [Theileria parva strain Muguga]
MNKCIAYNCIFISIIIRYINCSDKDPDQTEVDSDEEDNFDVIVSQIENLLEDETAGDSVISDNIKQHGLGHIVYNSYGSESISTTQPTDFLDEESGIIEGPSGPHDQVSTQTTPIPHLDKSEVGDDKKEAAAVKPSKISESLIFMKKGDDGGLFQMIEGQDYKLIFDDGTTLKFEFYNELEQVIYNGDNIYVHMPKRLYALELTCNKTTNVFVIALEDSFLYIDYRAGMWRANSRKIPNYVKFYGKDSEGVEFEFSKEHYSFYLTEKGAFRYVFFPEIPCAKVVINNRLIWEKTPEDKSLLSVHINIKGDVFLKFKTHVSLFAKKRNEYKYLYDMGRK